MALELKKIGMEYQDNNVRHNFGLMSWAHSDELYPEDIPHVPNSSNIDWSKMEFDHENVMSSYDLQENPLNKSRKLWQKPAKCLLDGETCSVCFNQFGPEGAWALGS